MKFTAQVIECDNDTNSDRASLYMMNIPVHEALPVLLEAVPIFNSLHTYIHAKKQNKNSSSNNKTKTSINGIINTIIDYRLFSLKVVTTVRLLPGDTVPLLLTSNPKLFSCFYIQIVSTEHVIGNTNHTNNNINNHYDYYYYKHFEYESSNNNNDTNDISYNVITNDITYNE